MDVREFAPDDTPLTHFPGCCDGTAALQANEHCGVRRRRGVVRDAGQVHLKGFSKLLLGCNAGVEGKRTWSRSFGSASAIEGYMREVRLDVTSRAFEKVAPRCGVRFGDERTKTVVVAYVREVPRVMTSRSVQESGAWVRCSFWRLTNVSGRDAGGRTNM